VCKCVTVRGVPLQGVAAHWNYLCTALCLISAPDRCISRTFQFFFPAWSGKAQRDAARAWRFTSTCGRAFQLGYHRAVACSTPVPAPPAPVQLPSSSSCLPQRPPRTEVGRNNLEVPSCLARRVCTSRQVLGDIQSCFVPRLCCNWPASAHASNSSSTRLTI